MKKTVFRNFAFLIIVSLLTCTMISTYVFSRNILKNNVTNMMYSLQLMDYTLDYNGDLKSQIEVINQNTLGEDSRVTVIDENGTVLADSSVDEVTENHIDRKEVQEAFETGTGQEVRYSSTLHTNMLYVAYLSDEGLVLRLSVPYSGLMDYIALGLPGMTVSVVISLVISLALSRVITKKMTDPLEEISAQLLSIQESKPEFDRHVYEYDELNDIAMVTDKLANKINQTIASLKREKNKVHYILDNMQEGMIVIDEDDQVILINHAANEMFGCQDVGKGQSVEKYIQEKRILKLIKSKKTFEKFQLGDHYYSIHKAKIDSGVFKHSRIILFLDVTQEEMAMKMKQVFFSNASHELKTPLTSIQGYAELLNQHFITDEKQKDEFVERILKETKNMTRLINDILIISKIENHQVKPNLTTLHLNLIVEDLFHTLSPLANDRQIKLLYHGDDNLDFYGDLDQMNQLLTNLLYNSIKYGTVGGWVSLKLSKKENWLKLVVEDNGIGIPDEDIPHITERFYRVDKGRTKAIEGTGLGLAIVKHIVQIYDGELKIKSKLGVGTKITIYLKEQLPQEN